VKPAVATPDLKLLEAPRWHQFVMKVDVPPEWRDHWFRKVPFVGGYTNTASNLVGHVTTLEENAGFIAEDLASGSLEWNLRKVKVKDKMLQSGEGYVGLCKMGAKTGER
jgi:hypothetical protein